MKAKSFAELYSEQERLPVTKVSERLFRQTLYPHAHPIAWIVRRLNRRHFLSDYEFIEEVGHLRSLQDFSLVLGSHIEHPANRGLLRRAFRIRISARRMLRIVRAVFGATPTASVQESLQENTLEPFGKSPTGKNAPMSREAAPPS